MSSLRSFFNIHSAVSLVKNAGYQCWVQAYNPLFWIVSLCFIYWRDTQQYLLSHYYQPRSHLLMRQELHQPTIMRLKKNRHSKSTHKRSGNDDVTCMMEKDIKGRKAITFINTHSNASTLQGHQQWSHILTSSPKSTSDCSRQPPKSDPFLLKDEQQETYHSHALKKDTTRRKSLLYFKISFKQWKWTTKIKKDQKHQEAATDTGPLSPFPPPASHSEARRRSSLPFIKRRSSRNSTASDISIDSSTSSDSSNRSKKDRVRRFLASVKQRQRCS